jgi:hypothetical protein
MVGSRKKESGVGDLIPEKPDLGAVGSRSGLQGLRSLGTGHPDGIRRGWRRRFAVMFIGELPGNDEDLEGSHLWDRRESY